VPSDALQFPTEITMTPVTDIPDLPFAAGLGAAVKLEPEGLRFYNFVTLTIEPAVSIPLANQTFFGFQSTGGDFHLVPPVLDSTVIQMKLLHFSGVGVSSATDTERAAVLQTSATDVEARLEQSIAEQIRLVREEGMTLDPSVFNIDLQQYMDYVVTPRVAAAGASCANARLAMQTLIVLMRQKELLGLGTDTTLKDLADGLVPTLATECLNEAYEFCVTSHDLTAITTLVLGWERQRVMLGYADESMPWDPTGQNLIKQCLQFELAFSSTEESATTSAVTGTIPLMVDLTGFPSAIKIKSHTPAPLDLASVSTVGACNQPGVDNSNNMDFVVSNINFLFGGTDNQTITSMEMEYLPLNPTTGIAETSCSGTPVPLSTVTAWNTNYLYTHQLEDNGTGTLVSKHWEILGGDPYAQRLYTFTTPGYGQTTMTLRHTPGAIDTTDATAPSVPDGLTATATASNEIELVWGAATDANGVKGYKVYRDGTYIKATTATAMLNTGLTASTQYCYQVAAYDAAGNESTKSTQQCATTQAATTEALNGVAWSGTKFVAVGENGTILTSSDGTAWTPQTSGTTDILEDVTWSGTQFVAMGLGGTILTSPSGTAWIAQPPIPSNSMISFTWSGTQFVAVGFLGNIFTSPNGTAWTAQTSGTTLDLWGVTWSGTQFAAVGGAGGMASIILTSSNGTAWTAQTSGATSAIVNVIWSGTQFVAVGNWNTILTSPNGTAWTAQTSQTSSGWRHFRDVAWSGTQFVAVGYETDTAGENVLGLIMTSPNGTAWTARTSGTINDFRAVTWSGTQFVAVGFGGTILTSPDGITWTTR